MEKPGRPKACPRHLKPEKGRIRIRFDQTLGGTRKVAWKARQCKGNGARSPIFCSKSAVVPAWCTIVHGRRDDRNLLLQRFSDLTLPTVPYPRRGPDSHRARWVVAPPNRGHFRKERSVKVFARYIAIWRGRTTLAVRREDSRSEWLTLYCRATTRRMSST
jgi:hypothetical protein